jgi:TetR/AcrR family transcriptional repressor of nem operon
MRYTPEHKKETCQKIVQAAGALAKKEGFGITGVDGLMEAAGMTSGAFYKHFQSKEQLLDEIVITEIRRSIDHFLTEGGGLDELLIAVQKYLSRPHVNHPDKGCILPALSGEVAHASTTVRESFERELFEMIGKLDARIDNPSMTQAVLSMMVGGVLLARAMSSKPAQTSMLSACQAAITQLIKPKFDKIEKDSP